MRVRLWLIVLALLSVALPIQAQGTFLYFPIILKDPASMAYKSTLGIISPYGNSNYVLNSSGETTDNFSVQGSASVSRVTTFQKYGLYSYQITTTGDGDGINLTLSSLTSAPHYVTFRGRLAEAVRLNVTIGSATKEARLLERIDTTWSLYYATFSSAEVSGQTNLRVTQIGAGANTMYLDGAQVEPNKLTTYIDGTQEGCRWNGATHASISTRSADSRAGGVVKDFWQDYGFVVERVLGAGSVTETLNIDSYAFLPGGELNSSKIQPREFTVIGFFLGDTREDLHARVQSLELELGLNTYPGQQPIRLRYSGARVLKEIAANYTEGLEGDLPIFYNDEFSIEGDDQWQRNYTFRMKASIQFIATDPFWYEVGESAALLDTNDTATFRYIAGRLQSTGQWSNLGITGNPTGFGDVYTIAISPFDGKIYIGGAFKDWN
ncbi:MAG: phage tail family protein, partial [Nitrospira sp.]|nr:phage tail family protein [Nitrospira sp.]